MLLLFRNGGHPQGGKGFLFVFDRPTARANGCDRKRSVPAVIKRRFLDMFICNKRILPLLEIKNGKTWHALCYSAWYLLCATVRGVSMRKSLKFKKCWIYLCSFEHRSQV